jgi:CHAT domain-containing protein
MIKKLQHAEFMNVTIRFFYTFFFLTLLILDGLPLKGQEASDSLMAVEYFRQAVNHGRNMEPEQALENFTKSLEYRKRVFGEKHYRLGSTYMGMAIQYKNLYQLDNAYRYYRIAEEMYLHNAPENDPRLGDIYTNIGNYFRIQGNYAEAIRYHEQALAIYKSHPEETVSQGFTGVIYNLAECLHLSDREEEALSLLKGNVNKGSFNQRIQLLNLMAAVHFSMGDIQLSKSILREIIASITGEYGPEDYSLADQYTVYGQFLINISQTDSGLVYLNRADKIYAQYENTQRDLAELYQAVATAWIDKPVSVSSLERFNAEKSVNLGRAAEYCLKALNLLNDSVNVNHLKYTYFENSDFPLFNIRLLNQLGNSLYQLAHLNKELSAEKSEGYLKQALDAYSTSSDLAVQVRTSFISQESKILFSELQRHIFSNTLSAAYDLFNTTGDIRFFDIAYENAGRSKAASLFDNLSEAKAKNLSLIPDSLMELENLYNSNLAFYRERLFDEIHSSGPDSARISVFRNQIFDNEQKRNDLRAYLENNYNDYYELKYNRSQLSLKSLQRKLRRNEALVEYIISSSDHESDKGTVYIFAVNKNDFTFKKASTSDHDYDAIGVFHRYVSSLHFLTSGHDDFKNFCEASYHLYDKLIGPVHEIIRDKRITIIPDGILSYLPFEALLTSVPDTNLIHFHDLPYLILKHPVSYVYSSELFMMKQSRSLLFSTRAVAYAPDYSQANYNDITIPPLATIEGIFEEVEFLSKNINALSFKGEKATEAHFRENASHYDILHLAMHTLINDSLPLFSRLVFYPSGSDNIHNDGLVNTSDIYNLDINARMAVLSACNTGRGTLRNGEGVMSLARAFLYAGCPSVVMTLWDVEDRSGTEIMKEFYRNLKKGKPKDIALRHAKLAHIRKADPLMSHPHFWLAYIAIGETEPLYTGKEVYIFGIILVIILILVVWQVKKAGPPYKVRQKYLNRKL